MEKFYSYSIDSPVCNRCTMYINGMIGLGIIQQRYNPEHKYTWWGPIDRDLADDIYGHPDFPEYMADHAGEVVELRKVMWALRMPKIPKQPWQTRF